MEVGRRWDAVLSVAQEVHWTIDCWRGYTLVKVVVPCGPVHQLVYDRYVWVVAEEVHFEGTLVGFDCS